MEPLAGELDPVEHVGEQRDAAQETQNAVNIVPVICGPSRVNVVGWMKSSASRIARKLIGISTTPKSA